MADVFCDTCTQKIMPVVSTSLQITQSKNMSVFAISDYKYPLKLLILSKGWSDIAASVQLGQLLWDMTNIKHLNFDYIVPIPLHWSRFAWRGYNQAEEIAKIIAKKSGKPVVHVLKRIKRTRYQSQLKFEDRKHNVKNVFALNLLAKDMFKNKHILLVDDLMTTGATLQDAARELFKVKTVKVSGGVVCRVI